MEFVIDFAGFVVNFNELKKFMDTLSPAWKPEVGQVLFYASSSYTSFFDFEVEAVVDNVARLVAVLEEKHAYDEV